MIQTCAVQTAAYIRYQWTNPSLLTDISVSVLGAQNSPTCAKHNMIPIIWSTEFIYKNYFLFTMKCLCMFFVIRMCRFLVSLIYNIWESISLRVCKEGIAVLPRVARCVWSSPPAYLHGSLYIAWFLKLQVLLLVALYNYRPTPRSWRSTHFISQSYCLAGWLANSRVSNHNFVNRKTPLLGLESVIVIWMEMTEIQEWPVVLSLY
jgi:hypothetical protein